MRRLFEQGDASKVHPGHVRRLPLILSVLHAAEQIEDVDFPGSGLHLLRGKLSGFWAAGGPAVATRTHVRIDRGLVDVSTVLRLDLQASGGAAWRVGPASDEDLERYDRLQ